MGSKRIKMNIQTASKGECPVCFQIPRGKIFNICENGHYLCETCSTQVTTCPECRSPGLRSRNLLAERFLDDIKFPCCWSGCGKTMNRSELSSHENHCVKNPDTFQFCSTVVSWSKCEYRFTSTWLSEPENCTNFLNHVSACLGDCLQESLQYGQVKTLSVNSNDILLEKHIPSRRVSVTYKPVFDRLGSPNQNKAQLFFLMPLVEVDRFDYKSVSFVYVQLTPETTSTQVKFSITGNPNARMDSQWGENSSSSINWTQKTIDFKQFMDIVKPSQSSSEAGIQLPFSVPYSFLSKYYLEENRLVSANYFLEQTS